MSDVTPDEFGRVRVTDRDTGHRLSLSASAAAHGNYTVLKQPASDPLTGEALPPEHGAVTPSGQSAEKKESGNG